MKLFCTFWALFFFLSAASAEDAVPENGDLEVIEEGNFYDKVPPDQLHFDFSSEQALEQSVAEMEEALGEQTRGRLIGALMLIEKRTGDLYRCCTDKSVTEVIDYAIELETQNPSIDGTSVDSFKESLEIINSRLDSNQQEYLRIAIESLAGDLGFDETLKRIHFMTAQEIVDEAFGLKEEGSVSVSEQVDEEKEYLKNDTN